MYKNVELDTFQANLKVHILKIFREFTTNETARHVKLSIVVIVASCKH